MTRKSVFRFLAICSLLTAVSCRPAPANLPATATSKPSVSTALFTVTAPAPTLTAADPSATIRQAMAYCTDRSALVRAVYPWLPDTRPYEAVTFIFESDWSGQVRQPDEPGIPYNPQRGMALLDDLGWTLANGGDVRTNASGDSLALTLTTTEADFRQVWTAVWAEQMKACGIQITRRVEPAAWLFGADTGLARSDFELAAFAYAAFDEAQLRRTFTCEQIPAATNGWQGQNFSGWCRSSVQQAVNVLAGIDARQQKPAALQTIRREFLRDLPVLPLFARADVMAVHPSLENFEPTGEGIHSWNAARWEINGSDTIVLGSDGEPAGLNEPAYIAEVIRTMIEGRDAVRIDGQYQAVLLSQVPSVENGMMVESSVLVQEGEPVVDAAGNAVRLVPGVDVVLASGELIAYTGGAIELPRRVVDFHFLPGLVWSDGSPVRMEDYALGYRAACGPADAAARFPCAAIAEVEFVSDTHYRVRWKPGFGGTAAVPYFLPPFRRAPAHRITADGRALAEIADDELPLLHELRRDPIGVGPYVLSEWVYGSHMTLVANPYYFEGPPATPRIMVRFLQHADALAALLRGDVDILDWETIGPPDIDEYSLAQAQQEGNIRLVVRPSQMWEQITFHLGDGSAPLR